MHVASILESLEDGTPEMAQANAADKAGGISVSLSYGTSSSQSKQTAQSDTARGSTVKSGGTTTIKATGGGENSNLTLQGSEVSAKVVNLEADNQVAFLAAQNTSSQTSSNSNNSASVGVAAQLGNGGGGIGFTGSLSAGRGRGSGNGSETTYTNTHIAGQNSVTIQSGGDTTLKGATVEGKQVTATVGGNLNIESLQDTVTYAEKNQQAGVSGMVGLTQTGAGSGSANFAKSNINSNYASVTEQSALKAGDGGFTVNVQGNTDLKGGAITSTQAAIDNNKNTFQTGGTLTTSDIQNKADYKATSVSVSVGVGSSPLPGQGLSSTLTGAGLGKDSGSTSSTTTAGISGIAGDTAKRTGDNAQGIGKIFDADKVRQEIQAQTQITQEFGKQASTAIASYSEQQKKDLQAQINDKKTNEADKAALKEQLNQVLLEEKVLNILVGAVTGLGETMVTKESLATAVEQMRAAVAEDSAKFKGVVDKDGKLLFSNQTGDSAGVDSDGKKQVGTRANLDLLCGVDNSRCAKNADGSLALTDKGQVEFIGAKKTDGTSQTYAEFLQTEDGKKMTNAPFGGQQGSERTWLFGEYTKGGIVDRLLEAFAGPHDTIGGKWSGLYDEQGNTKRGMSSTEAAAYNVVSGVALIPAAPFAAAKELPPEVWKAIGIFLKAGQ
jgi:filamentous hemagglutinin